MCKGTLHFTIGEDFGLLLMNIAHEHLVYGNDPLKAIKTLTDSLIGLPTEYAVKILKGEMILNVDEKTQNVIMCNREENNPDHKQYPKVNVMDFVERQSFLIEKHSTNLIAAWKMLQNQIAKTNGYFHFSFDYDSIFKFIAGNNEDLLDELRENIEINEITLLINTTKDFIQRADKTLETMRWMFGTFKDDELNKTENVHKYLDLSGNAHDDYMYVLQLMQETLNMNFDYENLIEDDSVQSYIANAIAIEETIKKGIEPVDIMDNWSAGWLSPDCKFYGLNGDIANMLHNQIADALQESGQVPMSEDGHDVNPDSWLEQQGWVKIHGNNVHFAGCLNYHINKPNVNLNEEQVKTIAEYISECHSNIMKLGWKLQKCTPTMFMMAFKNDIIAMNKKYFEF